MAAITQQPTILLVDDEEIVLASLKSLLALEADYLVVDFLSPRQALEYAGSHEVSMVISDFLMPEMDGIGFLARLRELRPDTIRIILTGYADKENAIKAINEVGIFQYIEKPWDNDELLIAIRNGLEKQRLTRSLEERIAEIRQANADLRGQIAERQRAEEALRQAHLELQRLKDRLQEENLYLQEEIKLDHNFEAIITRSEALKQVLRKVEQVATTDSTVLVLGETGTGKELLARAVHNISPRRDRPLVKVNCAALPVGLVESELFGHEKGAFTGALSRRIGRFELAHGGTLFLDEIGDLPLELQAKLLRVLQEGEFERLGSARTVRVDVRVIAATNRNLQEAMADGEFRQDLYYRLSAFPILLPPLRERREDIPLLVQHFVQRYAAQTGNEIRSVSPRAIQTLEAYPWPGNVRELEHVVERGVITSRGQNLEPGDWLPRLEPSASAAERASLEDLEREHIIRVLESTGWRVSGERGAATILGLKRTTLEARMRKLGIVRPG